MRTREREDQLEIRRNGQVGLFWRGFPLADISPEVFTEGWTKHVVGEVVPHGFDGSISLPGQGLIGLSVQARRGPRGTRFRFRMVALEDLHVIHVRLVASLQFDRWVGAAFRLGSTTGEVPEQIPDVIQLAEASAKVLVLGPSVDGLKIFLESPQVKTVLQDNRHWSPYLQNFVTNNEPSDTPWVWQRGREKSYEFILRVQEVAT